MFRAFAAATLLLVPAPVATAQLPPNSTPWSDGIPPERYQGNGAAIVLFVSPSDIEQICGKAQPPMRIIACSFKKDGAPFIALPNPCLIAHSEYYAKLECHELGHVNGWPALHGD